MESRAMEPSELKGGLSINEALQHVAKSWEKQHGVFDERWANPKFDELRRLLSEPITEEQALALQECISSPHQLATVIYWLKQAPHIRWRRVRKVEWVPKDSISLSILIVLLFTAVAIAIAYNIYTSNLILLILIGLIYLAVHIAFSKIVSEIIVFLRLKMIMTFNPAADPLLYSIEKKTKLLIGVGWPITGPAFILYYGVGWSLGSLFKKLFKL